MATENGTYNHPIQSGEVIDALPLINGRKDTVFVNESGEMDEIISEKPSFLVRWGISLLLLILLLLLGVSWFIQNPDIVTAKGTLNSINAPKEVIAHSGGKLIRLLKKEGDTVHREEVLGFLESIANPEQVIALAVYLKDLSSKLQSNQTIAAAETLPALYNQLGELQSPYQTFIQAHTDFLNYLNNGFYVKKMAMLENDMSYLKKLHTTLIEQQSLTKEDLALTDTTFRANESLKNDKVISAMDFRNEKSRLLAKQMLLPQISSSIINNESNQNQKAKEIAELENQIRQQKGLFMQSVNTLLSQVDEWERKYLLIAGIDGRFNLSGFIQENQQIKAEQVIGFIDPGNSSYFIEAFIPQYNSGKININQDALLRFPAYPHEEFGKVKGRISFISNISSDSGYLAKVVLPEGLVSNYNKTFAYRTGLSVDVDIVTKKRRLLDRFLSNIKAKINN